jgi:hypothetical protein
VSQVPKLQSISVEPEYPPSPSTLWGRILTAAERAPTVIEILAWPAAKAFFEALHIKYDYVTVDLARLAGVRAYAAGGLVNCYVEWSTTKADAVQWARRNPRVRAPPISCYDTYRTIYRSASHLRSVHRP